MATTSQYLFQEASRKTWNELHWQAWSQPARSSTSDGASRRLLTSSKRRCHKMRTTDIPEHFCDQF
eukprot:274217-Chlamydomonas_euryale.AAC.8